MLKAFLSFLVVCALVVAQEEAKGPPQSESWGDHLGPAAPNAAVVPIDWAQQSVLVRNHVPSASWRAEHPGWTITIDPRTGMPWRAFGPGIEVASAGAAKAGIVEAAGVLKDQLAAVSGLDPAGFRFSTAAKAGRLWYVDFEQVVSGASVVNGGMTMRIDQEGRLVLWGGRFVDPKPVASAPAIGSDQAVAAALAHLGREGFIGRGTVTHPPSTRLVVHVTDGRDSRVPTLAWFVETRTDAPAAWWKVFVDASDASVLEYWNDVREHGHEHGGESDVTFFEYDTWSPIFMAPLLAFFSGVSIGTVHDGVLPQAPPVLRNFNDLYVICNGSNVVTDATGAYSFNGGGASVPVTSGLDGIHTSTNNLAGVQAAFTATGSTGTLDVVWTDANSTLAERDAFFFTNQAWNNLMLRNPAETLFSVALPANVNLNSTCNAFYNGLSINFYAAGGACINTAYSASVVAHEYGHHVTNVIYTSHAASIPGGLGEGFSDCQAGAMTDSSLVGPGWSGPGTVLRNMDNTCQWYASCGGTVHSYGKIIGACYWHTRQLLAAAYGRPGKVMIDEYLYQHFHGTPMNEVESCMEMLLLNDDDANLANGTPDFDKFYQGFTVLHSVPFPLQIVAITHAPVQDTMDQLQDYQLYASGTPNYSASIASATARYSINGGAYTSIPMVGTGGGNYAASIPVQPPGTTVRYYLEFVDANGRKEKLPADSVGPPAVTFFKFLTFRPSQFFADGFEVASGWVSATQAGTNDWDNLAPNNPYHAYDPPTAFAGTKCWGTDLSLAFVFDGNYANNVHNHLTSPTINCTGQTGVSIVYRRWLTVEDGAYDHARIRVSNDGGATYTTVWQNAAGANHIDQEWIEHSVDISAVADNHANVKIRFEMQSDPLVNFGGWNIDAFTLAITGLPPLSQLGSATPGASATIRTSGLPGDAVILAVDVATSTNHYAGVGTFSLNAGSPSILVLFDGTVLPPSGILDFTFTVPAAIGVTGYFEGLLFPATSPPLLITNVLPFTIL